LLGELGIRFLAEFDHIEDGLAAGVVLEVDRGALLDVAEAGAGPGGLNANGNQFAGLLGGGDGGTEGALEGGAVLDEVIGGEDDHGGAVIPEGDPAGAEGDGGGGIALGGLRDDVFGRKACGEGADGGFLVLIGEDEDVIALDEAIEAVNGLLQKGGGGEEGEELFGTVPAGKGPEAFAGAAGEN